MSISPQDWDKAIKYYEEVCDKVKSVLGYNPISSDHYGRAILYSEIINTDTHNSKIIEIHNKFVELNEDLINVFKKYKVDFKDEYFYIGTLDGMLRLFGIIVDVYRGIDALEPIIKNFANVYHKVKTIASKYDGLDENYFYVSKTNQNNIVSYRLYDSLIDAKTSDIKIENIISYHFNLNKKVNELLNFCNYKYVNQIYPHCRSSRHSPYSDTNTNDLHHEYKEYYLFTKLIDEHTHESELLKIIHMAQLFESNLKFALKELKINDEYKIVYDTEVWIQFGGVGDRLSLDMNYEKIKSIFKEKAQC